MDENTALLITSILLNFFLFVDKLFSRVKKCRSACCEIDQHVSPANSLNNSGGVLKKT